MSAEEKGKEERLIPEDVRKHLRAARREFRKSIEALLPPDFVAHRRAARREMLLAVRSLIDHALEKMEEGKAA
jgi:hypothetical protein